MNPEAAEPCCRSLAEAIPGVAGRSARNIPWPSDPAGVPGRIFFWNGCPQSERRLSATDYFAQVDHARKHRLKRFAHLFSGLLILFHGYERFDHGHATWWVFILAGLVFLSVALLHGHLARRWARVDMVFFVIEAILSFVIMGEYFKAGKSGLPFMYLLAGIGQLVAAMVNAKRRTTH
jgi:hypothetical protein